MSHREIKDVVADAFGGNTDAFNQLIGTSVLKGIGIVSIFAWVQSYYPEARWSQILNPPHAWSDFEEWNNLRRIRHCFAHSYEGDLLVAQGPCIIAFHQRLVNGEFTDDNGNAIKPYYKIENNRVVLENNAVRRARALCIRFLDNHTP